MMNQERREKMITFMVHGEARGQGRPRAAIRGRHATVYEKAEDKSYKGLIQFSALKALREQGLTFPIVPDGRGISVWLFIYKLPPKSFSKKKQKACLNGDMLPRSKPDADNVAKIFLDAMNKVIYRDDSDVTELIVRKSYSQHEGVQVIVSWTPDESAWENASDSGRHEITPDSGEAQGKPALGGI